MTMRHNVSGSDSTSEEESDAQSNSEESGIEALTGPRQQVQAVLRRESNYSPPSNSSDSSESESGSGTSSKTDSSQSGSEFSAQNSPQSQRRPRILEDDSDIESAPSAPRPKPKPKLASSIPRSTPIYDFCPGVPPTRRATRNINYAAFYQSDDSDSDSRPHPRARGRRKCSDSEFEASSSERSLSPSASSEEEVSSEEEYLPSGRRKGRGKKRQRKVGWWRVVFDTALCWSVTFIFGFCLL